MLAIVFAPEFVRSWKKLESDIKDDALERIEMFKDLQNHKRLKVHKLSGKMKGDYAFSINFHYRILFEYSRDKKTAYFLDIGDHTIYK